MSITKKFDVMEVLHQLGPLCLARFGSIYSRWIMRNSRKESSGRVSFAEWVDNYDQVNTNRAGMRKLQDESWKRNASVEAIETRSSSLQDQVVSLNDQVVSLKDQVVSLISRIDTLEGLLDNKRGKGRDFKHLDLDFKDGKDLKDGNKRSLEDLRVPISEIEFDRYRTLIYDFNKENHKREKKNLGPKLFGHNGCFSKVKSLATLEAFLVSQHATDLGIPRTLLADFEVCVVNGDLCTLDIRFKGGIGFPALWCPKSKYTNVPSEDWCNEEALDVDPRKNFIDPRTGERWDIVSKKRKV